MHPVILSIHYHESNTQDIAMAGAQLPPASTRIWRNARIATMQRDTTTLDRAALVTRGERIAWVGPETDLPADLLDAVEIVTNCDGRLLTPGLVDCHTHLVWAGHRAREFELRLAGATYEEIARAGGGIVSSVAALRAASATDLLRQTLPRLDALLAEGVTTVEIKSGYGLDLANERKSLQIARRLGNLRPVGVSTTFLGAHALPPDMHGDKDAYITAVIDEMLPAIAAEALADAVDGFAERIAFSNDQIARVFEAARGLGLPVKLHADQLSDTGAAALAATFGALSADHLEYTSESGVQAMAAAGTVAVLLPGAWYFLRERQVPPIDLFRRYGVPIAVATDANPGTSPLTSILLAMNMAATCFGLTVEECLLGTTRHAATALGRGEEIGRLVAGMRADFAVWNVEQPAELAYRMGFNPLHQRVWGAR